MSQIQSQVQSQIKTKPTESGSVLSKSIPVQMTQVSTFDDSFSFLKERFAAEMRRMDEEMNKFSADLINLYGGQSSSVAPAPIDWETLSASPLIVGEGEDRQLKLQFDLSQFEPTDIKVQIANDVLVITAQHVEKNDTTSVMREFKREFLLPKGIDTNNVNSLLSRDGVLSVQAPLPQITPALDNTVLSEQEEDPSKIVVTPGMTTAKDVTQTKDAPKKIEPSSFEQKRATEHKKAHDQKAAHDDANIGKKSLHEQKALEIAKERATRQPSQQSQGANETPHRGTSRLSKTSKK